MTAGTKIFLLFYFIILLGNCAKAQDILTACNPDSGTVVKTDGYSTVISVNENNVKDICLAKVIEEGGVVPGIVNNDEITPLGLSFKVCEKSFCIYMANVQDFEKPGATNKYEFTIGMSSGAHTVKININNIDDNDPYFFMDIAKCEVPEYDITKTSCKVTIYDNDGILDGMKLEVLESGNVQNKIILTETGRDKCDKPSYCIDAVIEIKENLDFYESAVHSLTLQATDSGNNKASIPYMVTVTAVNKQAPKITPDHMELSIKEKFSGIITLPNTMIVEDKDSGDFGTFSIAVNDAGECVHAFEVIPSGGYRNTEVKLTVVNQELLDYENPACRKFDLEIVAKENSEPTHIGTATVTVSLEDVNDESPVFTKDPYLFTVKENQPIGTSVGKVTAEDKDANDVIAYTPSTANFITIDADGTVKTATDFDHERQSEVIINVKAEDQNKHIAYSQITLKIEDENDVKPQLDMLTSPNHLSETAPSGTDLNSNIRATDPDSTADLEFSIDWANSRATKDGSLQDQEYFQNCIKFEIINPGKKNDVSIKLLVDDESKLDWFRFDILYLVVKVKDKNTEPHLMATDSESSITVTIPIDDENNCKPEFTTAPKPIEVFENTKSDTLIGFVAAEDKDGPNNNNIKYSIECGDSTEEYVTIDPEKGRIYTGSVEFDYENLLATSGVIDCTVTADDSINTGTATLTITVKDINDKTPQFIGNYDKILTIDEKYNEEKELAKIEAKDDDGTAEFNTITYKTNSSIFKIEPDTGRFYLEAGVGKDLDYDAGKKEFYVQVTIADNCKDGCASDSRSPDPIVIVIKTEDINDHNPVFDDGLKFPVTEEYPQDGLITVVSATDEDDGDNSKLTYEIKDVVCKGCRDKTVCGKNLFALADNGKESQVELRAADSFKDCWGTYEVNIEAKDNGNCENTNNTACKEEQTGMGTYEIVIADVNNHAPEFKSPDIKIEVNVENNTISGSTLIDTFGKDIIIEAVDDLDRDDNGTDGIKYILTGDDTANQFLSLIQPPNSRTAFFRLKDGFTAESMKRFKINVTACDANCGEEKKSSSLEVNIRVRALTQVPPTFEDGLQWDTTFTENQEGQPKVFPYTATDINNEDAESDDEVDPINYYIVPDGEIENIFTLDNRTLQLASGVTLDRETKANYTFFIAASNYESLEDHILEESKALVNIEVGDVNDCPPEFTQTLYTAGISIGDKVSQNPIATLYAHDPDLNDQLKYKMSDKISTDASLAYINNPFVLEEGSGNLLLNFNADDNSLKGTFAFTADVTDRVGNTATTSVKVYMITDDNVLVFTFADPIEYVDTNRANIEKVFKEVLENEARVKEVIRSSQNKAAGSETDNWTDVSTYFVDAKENKPIPKDEIRNLVNSPDIYSALLDKFVDYNLHLKQIESPSDANPTNMEGVLQTVLIVVSVVLGTLVIILFAAFFIKTRSLNRRLEALSETKFGSQASGLNRVGMAVPNTNKHAVEGSNPIWGNEDIGKHEFDNHSISSGDSDLIGVEENPEFGTGNFPSDLEAPRRPTGLPMYTKGPEFGANFNPLAPPEVETGARRSSVNPLAGANMDYAKFENEQDSETGSIRSNNASLDNSNFSFVKRPDTAPTTEL